MIMFDINHIVQPNKFSKEGLDHINISSKSLTRLGKMLDPSYGKVIYYPGIGKFSSVLNLWYWVMSDPLDDSLRNLSGHKLTNKIKSINTKRVYHFKAIIAYATYLKLKEYPDILEEIRTLRDDIVFLSYYTPPHSLVRVTSAYAKVIVEIISEVVKQIKLDKTEPDFISLTTRGISTNNYFLYSLKGN